MRTNENGFRGPLIPQEKLARTIRIVGIGDSIMFGWGVPEGQCYLERLQRKLNTTRPAHRWETINTAVPGYNGVMEVECVKEKGLLFDPDIILVGYVGNDFALPNFLQSNRYYWSLDKSYLLDSLRKVLRRETDLAMTGLLIEAPDIDRFDSVDQNLGSVPIEYRELVGVPKYCGAITDLGAIAKKKGFRLLVVAHHRLHPDVRNTLEREHIAYLESHEGLKRTIKAKSLRKSDLYVAKDDPHPNSLGHEILADIIFEYLTGTDILSQLEADSVSSKEISRAM